MICIEASHRDQPSVSEAGEVMAAVDGVTQITS